MHVLKTVSSSHYYPYSGLPIEWIHFFNCKHGKGKNVITQIFKISFPKSPHSKLYMNRNITMKMFKEASIWSILKYHHSSEIVILLTVAKKIDKILMVHP